MSADCAPDPMRELGSVQFEATYFKPPFVLSGPCHAFRRCLPTPVMSDDQATQMSGSISTVGSPTPDAPCGQDILPSETKGLRGISQLHSQTAAPFTVRRDVMPALARYLKHFARCDLDTVLGDMSRSTSRGSKEGSNDIAMAFLPGFEWSVSSGEDGSKPHDFPSEQSKSEAPTHTNESAIPPAASAFSHRRCGNHVGGAGHTGSMMSSSALKLPHAVESDVCKNFRNNYSSLADRCCDFPTKKAPQQRGSSCHTSQLAPWVCSGGLRCAASNKVCIGSASHQNIAAQDKSYAT